MVLSKSIQTDGLLTGIEYSIAVYCHVLFCYMLDGWSLLKHKASTQQQTSHSPTSTLVAGSAHSSAVPHTSTSFTRRLRRMAITPRSANYARLESGMGPSRNAKGTFSRFTWKRMAIGTAVFIAVVWLFGPRKPARSSSPSDTTSRSVCFFRLHCEH
jgi:hypothetical protein